MTGSEVSEGMLKLNGGSSSRKLERRTPVVLVVLLILTIWFGSASWIMNSYGSWDARSGFGDMFGAVNSLFSGLALAGVVYAILLQRQELALQRQELELTRHELERAATAQVKSADLLREQLSLAQSERDERAKERRMRALPRFLVTGDSTSAGEMILIMKNHGAAISDLDAERLFGATIRLPKTGLVPTGELLQAQVAGLTNPIAFAFVLRFTDVNGERRALRLTYRAGEQLRVEEIQETDRATVT